MTQETFKSAIISFLGLPYKWGGDDTIEGFDCSGLIQEILAMVGLDPKGDQTAQALHDFFVPMNKEGARDLGTLVFFGKTNKTITHVGLLIDAYTMIEAGGGGSRTNDIKAAAAQNAFVRLRPFTNRSDLVAVINPRGYPW